MAGIFKESTKRLREFRDEVSAWYTFLGIVVAAGAALAPFVQSFVHRYIQKGYQPYFLILLGVVALAALLFVGWTGYMARGVRDRNTLYYGFRRLSKTMSYEVDEHDPGKQTLRYTDVVEIATDRVVIYPIRYHWDGKGTQDLPKAFIIDDDTREKKTLSVLPTNPDDYYIERDGLGQWIWYFVAIQPPRYRSKKPITIEYEQTFHDKEVTDDPHLGFWVTDGDLQKLILRVKLPATSLPLTRCQYRHGKPIPPPSDREEYYKLVGGWIEWGIDNPKKDYIYRFDWRKPK